jgi:hypothetical protein
MSQAIVSATAGARTALFRLEKRSTLLITVAAVSFCTLAAWAERHAEPSTAANHALQGPAFGLAIPLAALSLVAMALGHRRLDRGVGSLDLIGTGRRFAVLGVLFGVGLVSALLGGLLGGITTWIAHGRFDGSVVMDMLASMWIGALAGAVYAVFFAMASTLGKRGGGRYLAFGIDWFLGSLTGAGAVVFPRAHTLNLLGAEPVLGLPQGASTLILLGLMGGFGALAVWRTPP